MTNGASMADLQALADGLWGRGLRKAPRVVAGPELRTNGDTITVPAWVLSLPDSALRYAIAHELGHALCLHHWVTCISGVAFSAGLPLCVWGFPVAGVFLLAFGSAVLFAYFKTLAFEAMADRAGARMLGNGPYAAGLLDFSHSRHNSITEGHARKLKLLSGNWTLGDLMRPD